MKPAITKPALVTILECRRVRCASPNRREKMIRNTMMLLPILAMATAMALTEKEAMLVMKTVDKIIRENSLIKTDQAKIKIPDKEAEMLAAAIRAGDKAAQERIVREIVAAQTK